MDSLLTHLRRTIPPPVDEGVKDSQLLERFLSVRDEAAFTALVNRHGAMVLGTCQRVLNNRHDAEDAFQAAFLVLVRKGASVKPRERLANWLYGVAYRTALRARAMKAKRYAKENHARSLQRLEAPAESGLDDLLPLLDRELSCLPEKYRTPVVLCDLEGKSRKAAARQLGWPEGTLSCRLARARTLLAKRLARYGLVISGGGLGTVLAQKTAMACVPPPLLAA